MSTQQKLTTPPAGTNENQTIRELMNLSGRVAVVTGGAGHIGIAICEALAELGASVVVVDRDADSCGKLTDRLSKQYQSQTLPLAIDLQIEKEVLSIPDSVENRFGRLDILVNCAAFVGASNLSGWVTDFANQSSDAWRMALELNLTTPFVLTQACAPALAKNGSGSVINVGSIYGVVGPDMRMYENTKMGNPVAYAASKGGLLQMTKWMSTVLAPNVRVNAICPGGIQRGQPDSFQEQYCSRTPMGRMGHEQDMKGAAAYLASDLSAYVTGQNLVVDGGWTAW
ncbi:3-oxoacyl-[acyl-carrier-protein] reductase FabG [Roseimaritima multifibrata]|uniref:3-oxoacyl-[acyl-carrier-protein] reductase FabG n=1 Tax=Roseimaritima multifibrata TaxID=1930274 RepID=A0A517MLU0_9BACT|nr:SDR family oxidoreductase [Roseimaritima multifibrata]QDS95820.1 3-oxoacyl-[acyl-carrier-protein] reductase FabG [Roseimaritima multifibrata]